MRGTQFIRAALVALPLLGGCATADNLAGKGDCRIYGGARLDGTLIAEGFQRDSALAKTQAVERPVLVGEGCCGLVDLPLSLVADTITLPITVPVTLSKQKHETDAGPVSSPSEAAHSASGSPAG